MMEKSGILLILTLFSLLQALSVVRKSRSVARDKNGTVYITSGLHIVLQPGHGGPVIINSGLLVCKGGRCGARLGSRRNPATSCKAILQNERFAKSGVYYIKTNATITKVYCYMDYIPGCGGGGWTTIMKTDGHKSTFTYTSALWKNKVTYNMPGGQSGVDNQETKLPTYWTMPFNSLCLGMKTSGNTSEPNWIRLKYRADSLYSVIADGRYRSFSIGRNTWKSLVPGSSLQLNCNKEGFNFHVGNQASTRIGILSNQENNCGSPDSRIGFGTAGTGCNGRADNSVSTGNVAGCSPDNGDKTIRAFGYILAK
ncbi:uncharacterized protein LOC116301896 [Actinia tenebrosa]|uniref:Uncharacterized protein LOC116301896 n=1 Tax=Actinia tenebrosa TaxID=6105 RepID=A0A6P8IJG4_ACTTE|nr:uncharacterized protein LOC116301896 [Actinia tenebrosa]XP_031566924.1 uncharacterized protein LOC116301896 [Actinia tenebrosa]